MPKKKAHKGMAKRLKMTKKGKVLGKKGGYHHKLVKRSADRKRHARKELIIEGKEGKRIKQLLQA